MLKRIFLPFIIFLMLLASIFFLMLFSDTPLVSSKTFTRDDIQQVRRFVRENNPFIPGNMQPNLRLKENEINQFLHYQLKKNNQTLFANTLINEDSVTLQTTLKTTLPAIPYLNLQTELKFDNKTPVITNLHAGTMQAPSWSMPLFRNIITQLIKNKLSEQRFAEELQQIYAAINDINIENQSIVVHYESSDTLQQQLATKQRQIMLGRTTDQRIEIYQKKLTRILAKQDDTRISLAAIFPPLFLLAQQRSDDDASASKENRALITAVALETAPKELKQLLTPIKDNQSKTAMAFTLERKKDLAKHFVISALLSFYADDKLVDLIGIYKEFEDSAGKSGFDVKDLLADQAGLKFANIATGKKSALQFQQRMIEFGHDETYFMPATNTITEEIKQNLLQLADNDNEAQLLTAVNQQLGGIVNQLPAYQNL